jgi:hypothetical protein
MRRALAPVALAAVCACSSSPAPLPSPTPADDFKHDIVFTMSMTVPASTELHQCQFVQLPEGPDVNVTTFAHEYTPGSHHFLLYDTDLTSIPGDLQGQYDCTTGGEPILAHATGIIYGGQVPAGEFAFPAGVAATLKAGQVLVMNAHYLNTQGTALDTSVKVGLDTTTPDMVQQQGGFFIFYDPFIDVPAHATASSGDRCYVGEDVTVVNAFSHYHYRGTRMNVLEDVAGQPRSTTPFYTTTDWEHPQPFQGPVTWKKGDWIRYQCDYDNMDSTEVFQGPNAKTSEMCVFAGLYYPKQAGQFENCDQESILGFGTNACSSTASCVLGCPAGDAPRRTPTGAIVGPCWEHCVASACDGAVDKLMPLVGCVGAQCGAECQSGASSCISCASTKCGMELGACSSQTCP